MARGAAHDDAEEDNAPPGKVRLDKWLWAARFFKTRALAAEAIDGGKVTVNDERPKRARLVQAGDAVAVRIGPYQHLLTVREVSGRRGSATVAQALFEESPASIAARALVAAQYKNAAMTFAFQEGKPSKKERRAIEKVRRR